MKRVPVTQHAPLANDRVSEFAGERGYLATGSVNDDGILAPELVTYESRPSRADLSAKLGDVCFARMQATRKVLRIDEAGAEAILSTGFAVLRPNPEYLYSGYLRSWVASDAFQFAKDRLCTGATQKAITNAKITTLPIPLPPLAEQKRIAEVLDAADALRAKRREALAQLDTLLQSTFLDMFGDPVTNPMGLPRETLKSAFEFTTGKLDSNAAVEGGKYPFFTCARETSAIDDYAFDCEALLLAGNNANADYSVKHYKGRFNAYQRTYVITINESALTYAYARLALEYLLGDLKRFSKGTNTKYLTMVILDRMPILVPPLDLQRRFAAVVESIEEQKASQRAHMAELDTLFASLQSRAFRGDL